MKLHFQQTNFTVELLFRVDKFARVCLCTVRFISLCRCVHALSPTALSPITETYGAVATATSLWGLLPGVLLDPEISLCFPLRVFIIVTQAHRLAHRSQATRVGLALLPYLHCTPHTLLIVSSLGNSTIIVSAKLLLLELSLLNPAAATASITVVVATN